MSSWSSGPILASSLIHSVVYASYFWMVGRAGSVFAAQVAYLVTGFGVVWAMILLGESYSGWVWLALGLVLGGLFLVQPRKTAVSLLGFARAILRSFTRPCLKARFCLLCCYGLGSAKAL